jgi:hypothetical protein
LYQAKSRFSNRLGRSHKRNDRSIGGSTGIHIQQPNTFNRFNGRCDSLDDIIPPSFRYIGYTLNKSMHDFNRIRVSLPENKSRTT